MKKTIAFLISVFALTAGPCGAVYGFEGLPSVFVDYEELTFPVEGEIIDGEAYVPIRTVLEKYLNRDIYFADTSGGRLLIADTDDGRFILNLNNGAYAYVIFNSSYGVISLFDNTGENKMGILEHKPVNKEGYTLLPVKEVLEILDASVSYDEDSSQISVVSDTYRNNIMFAGEPFPIVWVFSDMDIYDSMKLADLKGYEDLAEKCLEYYGYEADLSVYDEPEETAEDNGEEDYRQYFDDDNYYNDYFVREEEFDEIMTELFGYLYELSENSFVDGDLKTFLTGDFSDELIIDEELGEEESIENMAYYILDRLSGREREEGLIVGGEYEKAGRLCIMEADVLLELSQLDYNSISNELSAEIEKRGYYFDLIFSYEEALYGSDFWDSISDKIFELQDEYGDELFSQLLSPVYNYYNMFTHKIDIPAIK